MKRKWTFVPAWADYLAQLLGWIDYRISRFAGRFSNWQNELLDRTCKCEKCIERRLKV